MADGSSSPLDRRDMVIAAALLLAVFVVHALSPNATPFDSRWTVHTAMSILREADTDLDEYLPLIEADHFYMMECVIPGRDWKLVHSKKECPDGRLHNFYAVAVPFLATPEIAVMKATLDAAQPLLGPVSGRIPSEALRRFLRGDMIGASAVVELLVAAFWIAATSVLLYLVAREFLDRPRAVLIPLVFAFCTPAWSLASRALWQHGPSMMLLSLSLWMAVRSERSPGWARFLGAPLAVAFFVRASNAVAAAIFTLFVWNRRRAQFASFLLSAVPVALLFDLYNQSVYGTSLAPYSWAQREGAAGLSFHARFFEALAGNLVSPGRGLFVFVPLALLSIWGMFLRPRHAAAAAVRPYLMANLVLHWILVSSFEDWIGGHSFGPRYMSDMTPALVYFLIPVLERAGDLAARRRYAIPALAAVLALASFGIHLRGATHWGCWEWSATPVDINEAQWRVWDWSDPPFLR